MTTATAQDMTLAPPPVKTKRPVRKRKKANGMQDPAALLAELQAVQDELQAKEAELIKRERQLEEAESIGRMGHWYWKLGQDNFEWSREIYRIFGVREDELSPSLFSLNDMIHSDDMGRINQVFQRAMIEEKDYEMDFRITCPNGDTRHIRLEGRCAKDADEDVIALYGIMQDITERLAYESELRAERDRAERAYAAKSQFLANMSHELRTPLNAIIGFSDIMKQEMFGPMGNAQYLDYAQGINKSGSHLLDLIKDILDMSKIEAGKYELDCEELAMSDLMETAMHMVQARAAEAGVSLAKTTMPSAPITLSADRRATLQVLLNILSNAVKFSHEGGQIETACLAREDYVVIKITDHGIGIPAHKISDITKPFEQVSNSYSRDHEGSGLGLSITKELVEMHGGVLSIQSAIGVGTTVSIRLPYQAT